MRNVEENDRSTDRVSGFLFQHGQPLGGLVSKWGIGANLENTASVFATGRTVRVRSPDPAELTLTMVLQRRGAELALEYLAEVFDARKPASRGNSLQFCVFRPLQESLGGFRAEAAHP
jgi:hypothetical protein